MYPVPCITPCITRLSFSLFRSLGRAAALTLPLLVPSSGSGAETPEWIWQPRVQMTSADPDTQIIAGALLRDVEGGFHQVLEAWSAADGRNNAFGWYMNADADGNWPPAWDARSQVTRMPKDLTNNIYPDSQADIQMVQSNDGVVHFFYEAKFYTDLPPGVHIAYKNDEGGLPGGDPETLNTLPCTATSPRVFHEPQSDVLHLVFRTEVGTCYGAPQDPVLCYTRKTPADPTWAPLAFKTLPDGLGGIPGGGVLADPDGTVHLLGSLKTEAGGVETYTFNHWVGTPPGQGGWWDPGLDTLDLWTSNPLDEQSAGEAGSTVLADPDDRIIAAWSRPLEGPTGSADEVFLAVRSGGAWAPVNCPAPPNCNDYPWVGLQLTAADGKDSVQPKVALDARGTLHVIYREAPSYLWHIHNDGDPTDVADWSAPELLSFEAESTARLPSVVAGLDTLWVAYSVKTTPDCESVDCEREGFFKRGYRNGVPAGQTRTWQGVVDLEADFLVAAGGTLVVAPGTTITVTSNTDLANIGRYPDKVEIVVDGQLIVDGNEDFPVVLTSTGQVSGDWGGILFRDVEDDTTVSKLRHTEIEYPVFGVQLDSLACELFRTSFVDSESGDVYVDRDTRLPGGFQWVLTGGTDVKIASDVDNSTDDGGEVPTLSEIQIDGALRTIGTGALRDSVTFTPTAPGDFLSDDWYGIVVRGTGFNDGLGVVEMDYAEISHARYPLSLFLADTASVKRSWFHNYNQEGITDWASDALIEGCDIQRGPGASIFEEDRVGRVAIHLVATFGEVRSNRIFQQWERGIWADYSSTFCKTPTSPYPTDTLSIDGNAVIADEGLNTDARGIDVSWACKYQRVEVLGNNVQGWEDPNGGGITLRQSSDVVVDCNCLQGNLNGIHHRRDHYALETDADDGPSRAHDNYLVRNAKSNMHVWRPGPDGPAGLPRTAGIHLGTSPLDGGGNRLRLETPETRNYRLDAVEFNRVDPAIGNSWVDALGSVLNSESEIHAWNEFDDLLLEQSILVSDWITNEAYVPPCTQNAAEDTCQALVSPAGTAHRSPRRTALAEPRAEHQDATSAHQTTAPPTRFALHPPNPNPAGSTVHLGFDVPPSVDGETSIRVYDVRGRLVRTLLEAPIEAGRHLILWDTRASQSTAASGIYFIQMRAGTFRQTRRVTVLR